MRVRQPSHGQNHSAGRAGAERVVQEANDVARDRGWGTSFRGVCVLRAGTKGETRVVIEPFTLENLRMSGIEFGSGDWVIVSQR
jgi:hypothetical protein